VEAAEGLEISRFSLIRLDSPRSASIRLDPVLSSPTSKPLRSKPLPSKPLPSKPLPSKPLPSKPLPSKPLPVSSPTSKPYRLFLLRRLTLRFVQSCAG